MPCYNEEQRLPRTIEQIERYLDGKHVAYELILVDDGSADATRTVYLSIGLALLTMNTIESE